MSSEILTISHLAMRALEDNARAPMAAQRHEDGTWGVLLDDRLAAALKQTADEKNMTISDAIIHLFRRKS